MLYSHRSTYLHALYSNQANAFGFTEADRVLTIVPQFHVMAWGFPYSCLFAGADLVLPGKHLDPVSLAGILQNEKITVANGVPTIWTAVYEELCKNPQDISTVRALVIGGSAMPKPMMEAYEQDFGVKMLHAWGMTEMSPIGTLSKLQSRHDLLSGEEQRNIRAKQGTTFPGVELRIVDENGHAVAPDNQSSGEIQVRGACIIRSYYRQDPDPEQFTSDGWFRTGDVATIDAQGYIQITDRSKDLIRSGGEWISTIALETALSGHPDIIEAAVIAIPDKKWGERPLAAIVLKLESDTITLAMVRDFLAPDFAKFWLPDKVAIVDEVPKTSTGKFDKKVLRQMYGDGLLGT